MISLDQALRERDAAAARAEAAEAKYEQLHKQFELQRDNYETLVDAIYGGDPPHFEHDPLADVEQLRFDHDAAVAECARLKAVTTPYVVADERHVALWDAINEVVVASGGSDANTSPARMRAVSKVERALEALAVRVDRVDQSH